MAEPQAEGQEPQATPQEGKGQEPAVEVKVETKKPLRSAEELDADLRETRAEAARRRKSEEALQAKLKEYEDAKLTETEKTTKRVGELETTNQTLTNRIKELTAENIAAKAGAIDPDLIASKLKDQLEMGEDFVVTNADAAIAKLKERHPQQFRSTTTPSGGADQGARQTVTRDLQPGLDRLAHAYASSSKK